MAKIKITLKRSTIKCSERQMRVVRALGLRKTNSFVIQEDNDAIRGMVKKLAHLLVVEPVEVADAEEVQA